MTDKNKNLVLRVVSAVVLLPVAFWITWRGDLPFALICAAAAAVCAGELIWMFEQRIGLPEIYGLGVAGLLPLGAWLAAGGHLVFFLSGESVALVLAGATIGLLTIALFRKGPLDAAPRSVAVVALSWLYCGLLAGVVVGLRQRFGFAWVILLFAVTWGNDSLAYFAGRAFGRHKLNERISPKKTWEGFAGGLAGSIIAAVAVTWWLLPAVPVAAALVLGLGGAVLGPLGDLCESMLKRAAGVKDSGKLIPGHGGLLDRIDALLFVAPWVYACAAFLRS